MEKCPPLKKGAVVECLRGYQETIRFSVNKYFPFTSPVGRKGGMLKKNGLLLFARIQNT